MFKSIHWILIILVIRFSSLILLCLSGLVDLCCAGGAPARGRLCRGPQERGHPLQAHQQDQPHQHRQVQGEGDTKHTQFTIIAIAANETKTVLFVGLN